MFVISTFVGAVAHHEIPLSDTIENLAGVWGHFPQHPPLLSL